MIQSAGDNSSGQPRRGRQWTPMICQQLRLRHVYRIIGYNLGASSNEADEQYHYTLHSTAMSAPFYTSELAFGVHPKWAEMQQLSDVQALSCTGFVLRIWCNLEMTLTWGVHLSGLVYLGNQLADLRPALFQRNTVIFHMRAGFFTSCRHLRRDLERPLVFIDALNVVSTHDCTKTYKLSTVPVPVCDLRTSYSLAKLKRLQTLQISIRNKMLSVHNVCASIDEKLNPVAPVEDNVPTTMGNMHSNVRYAPQLLTMTHLNKLLRHEKPARVPRGELVKLQKQIEWARLRSRILQQERDRKSIELRCLKEKFNSKCDDNEERNLQQMEKYHQLSRDMEKLREWKREYVHQRELLHQLSKKLQSRRRQLMSELLQLYPIHAEAAKYFINGIELPHSDLLFDCSDTGLSVALGYCSHVLIMCASFLQIPLRYTIRHFGSRSTIEDHVTPSHEKYREFPLFTRGKDRMQFNNAVYLLNKNIAQYLHALGFKTSDLRTTLPNLLLLLQGKASDASSTPDLSTAPKMCSENASKPFASSAHHVPDPILDSLRVHHLHTPRRRMRNKNNAENPGLGEILAIPEAVLNRQMSERTFRTYMLMSGDIDRSAPIGIEEGTEMLASIDANGIHSSTKQSNGLEGSGGSSR